MKQLCWDEKPEGGCTWGLRVELAACTCALVFHLPQAADPSVIKEPRSLNDVWLFKLHREAPTKAYLLLK